MSATVETTCGHARWWRLNDEAVCIHPDHGAYPPLAVDLVFWRPGSVAENEARKAAA